MGFFSKAKDQMQQAAGAMSSPAGTMSDANTLNAAGAEMRRLWDVGLPGSAVIRDARDTGERIAGNTVLDLDLEVTVAGGEPYTITHRMTIAGSDTAPYAAGKQYNVKVDPEDRTNLTFAG